jgi:Na+-driven multidrug efflux pump
MIFLLPLLWIIPRYLGATGVWISMPIADCASITLAAILLTKELKRLREKESLLMSDRHYR